MITFLLDPGGLWSFDLNFRNRFQEAAFCYVNDTIGKLRIIKKSRHRYRSNRRREGKNRIFFRRSAGSIITHFYSNIDKLPQSIADSFAGNGVGTSKFTSHLNYRTATQHSIPDLRSQVASKILEKRGRALSSGRLGSFYKRFNAERCGLGNQGLFELKWR